MTSSHSGRVAVITGAAAGIGQAYARRLAQDGAAIAIADRDDAAQTVTMVEAVGGTVFATRCDVADPDDVADLADKVQAQFGRCDILVNNAGIYPVQPFDRITFADGDFITQGIEGRFDVAWLSHILHSEDAAGCAVILEKAMAALHPGGMILVQEFILDDTRDGPLFPALFSLNMLLVTPGGRSYSEGELMQMLRTAGATDVRRLPIELPNGAGVIAGTVPPAKS